ncbi:hypothetical protein JCM11641_007478 [Rhodosporidiobolus odoratus]
MSSTPHPSAHQVSAASPSTAEGALCFDLPTPAASHNASSIARGRDQQHEGDTEGHDDTTFSGTNGGAETAGDSSDGDGKSDAGVDGHNCSNTHNIFPVVDRGSGSAILCPAIGHSGEVAFTSESE